jgi:hypothetical protein
MLKECFEKIDDNSTEDGAREKIIKPISFSIFLISVSLFLLFAWELAMHFSFSIYSQNDRNEAQGQPAFEKNHIG